MKIRRVFRRAVCSFLIFALFALLAGAYLAEATLHPGRRPLVAREQDLGRQLAEQNNSLLEEVSISAADGAVLRAWNLHSQRSNGNAIVVLHGLSDNCSGMTAYAQILLRHGYDVLMPDARAHGASDGEMATYGLLETNDIHRWLDWLEFRERPACIFGFAESMGAAVLLQSLRSESRFVLSWRSHRSQDFVRLPTTALVSSFIQGHGWAGRYCDPSWTSSFTMRNGSTS